VATSVPPVRFLRSSPQYFAHECLSHSLVSLDTFNPCVKHLQCSTGTRSVCWLVRHARVHETMRELTAYLGNSHPELAQAVSER
jgi:hypothetical protein